MQKTGVDLGCWEISGSSARQYLAAVGDELPVYENAGFAPPISLAARVVSLLLDRLSLPDGAIHSLQDIETLQPVCIGSRVSAVADVEPLRERGGMRFLTVNFAVADADSATALLRGRTTVLLPADGAEDGEPSDAS